MASILDVIARPEIVVALLELTRRDASQQDLLRDVESSGVGHIDQTTMSRHLSRLEDLGLLEKPGKRGTYHLRFPQETLALVNAALALSQVATSEQAELEGKIGDLMRRAQVVSVPNLSKDGA